MVFNQIANVCIHVFLGLLKSGGTVVEGTAGNTGIGLAHICNARGYKCVIFMPDTQSKVHIYYMNCLHIMCMYVYMY